MAKIGFTTDPTGEGGGADLGDLLVPKDWLAEGNLFLFGYNPHGQLAANSVANSSTPIQTVAHGNTWKHVSLGESCSGIKTDGTLWTWGYGSTYAIGNGTAVHYSSPIQTSLGGTDWRICSSGGYSQAAIKTDGSLWTWGRNQDGECGLNSSNNDVLTPTQVAAGSQEDWVAIQASFGVMTGLRADGTLWSWGINQYGQLGHNDLVSKSTPTQIGVDTDWAKISASRFCTLAIKTDGTLWGWGRDDYGQLGTNDLIHRSSPVQVATGGTDWREAACGNYHALAIKTDGSLWAWGWNTSGQLGINNTVTTSSPILVTGTKNWRRVSADGFGTAAIRTDGTLWTWGHNQHGQLGNNSVVSSSSPVQIGISSNSWTSVSASGYFATAVINDLTV